MTTIAYVRVSTRDQSTDLQHLAMQRAGIDRAFEDHGVSGAIDPAQRPGWQALEAYVREGDVVVVWKLDRLGRSAVGIQTTLQRLRDKGVEVRSLTEGLDSSTPIGRAMLSLVSVFAVLERENTLERVYAGIDAARQRGVRLGRPPSLTPVQVEHAKKLRGERMSYAAIGAIIGCSAPTARRACLPGPTS